ncbi:hypothetical protein ABER99_20120 [Paenibacillus glucanolyticus]|jgi:hypothetical protein|uniref:Uncharacterized protein n=1 Tax=Paenibacillus glucanolyticus TaxID=59843 RepID=A0A163GMA5_9BACL|nr:hypothetical protein [Paenibacillus glucanolyticus]KZS45043.1 hypothetical protein AWU65_03415 [Paenibacillus glucanolyticus]OMF66719.1 hypothetical protein BK142_29300 [Paenibacillus glucanolyticus]
MNNYGLFSIEKRVQPALPVPYILTVKISEEPKGFYTRLYTKFQHNSIYIFKERNKKLFKRESIHWKAGLNNTKIIKGIEYSIYSRFRRVMGFNFETEIDMIDAYFALECFLDEILTKEFIDYQIAVNSEARISK